MTDLSMLQRVVRVLEDTTRSTSGAIQQSADLILEAWRDSGVGGVRISAGEEEAVTPAFPNAGSMQHVEFNVSNGQNGTIEVAYAPDAADQAPRAEQETVLKIVAEMLAGRLERRAAETVLRDREAQLAEAQRVARVGSWLLDIATQHLTWSDEHYRILGLEPGTDAVAYLEGLDFVHPDDRQMVRSLIDTVIRERSAYSVEVRIVQPDGTIRWVESRGAFVPDGRAGRVVGTALDITERVEAEQQRARMAEHIHLLLESTSDGLFGVDLAGHCTFINEAGAALLGYQPEEMVGQPIEPSAVLRHRDGRLLTVEYSVNPILEGEDVVGAVVAFRDVSERVQAEARVRESEQRLRLVTRATHDAVWDWDLITDSLTWNEAVEPLFGYPSGRIAPNITWWRERIHPDDRERILGSLSAALERGDTTWSDEYRYQRADGSYADVLDRGYIVREATGRAVRAIGAVQDVSDRKRAEAALAVRARQQAAAAALGLWALTDASLGLLMSTSVNMLVSVLEVELAGFLQNEPANDRLVLTVGAGWPEDAVGSAAAQVQPSMLLGRLLEDSAPVSVDDLSTDGFAIDPLLRDQGVRSGLAVAVPGRNYARGVLVAFARQARHFTEDDASFMQAIANVLGAAVERSESDAALRRREHEFKALVENTPDMIVRVGPDLHYQYVNPAAQRLKLVEPGQAVGDATRSSGGSESVLTEWQRALRRVLRTAEDEVLEVPVHTTEGQRFVHVSISPQPAADGSPESVMAVGRDVTEQRRRDAERAELYREVLERERRLQELVERALVNQVGEAGNDRRAREAQQEAQEQFTPREKDILRLLTRGLTNAQIARTVHLSTGTVKNYVARLLPRLNAIDRTQAAVRAIELGLVPSEDEPSTA